MADFDRAENCDSCQSPARYIFSSKIQFIGASVQNAEYNPGLGCVVKNKEHRAELAKQRGLVEIGTDYKSPDNIHKEFDKKREEARAKRWEDD
jgi:hypothetical protein